MTERPLKPIFCDVEGESLSAAEKKFFGEQNPIGFILFARNCKTPEQVKALTAELRAVTGRANTMILIDQEGGRVARLKPPHWRVAPPAGKFGERAMSSEMGESRSEVKDAVYANARLIASELYELGINVDCAPMADVRMPGSHDIIGDRAFSENAYIVSLLSLAMAEGLYDGGVLPVLKHIPGHGRALADSHEELPVVTASLETLEASDFVPFKALNFLALGMTAHIVYTALDADLPATLSRKAIDFIRTKIGFDGLLMSDDIAMKALKGDPAKLANQAIEAGCDAVMYCNQGLEKLRPLVEALPAMTGKSLWRFQHALSLLHPPRDFDYQAAGARVKQFVA